MKNKHLALSAFLLLSLPALAQIKHYPRLETKSMEVFEVGPNNMLVVDTLIMQDKSTVKFSPYTMGQLIAKVAYVGNNCEITAKGQDGRKGKNGKSGGIYGENGQQGESGQNGGDLELEINFASLGNLTIDTRGGDGGNGGRGGNGAGGTNDKTEIRTSTDSKGNTNSFTLTIPGYPGGQGGDGGTFGIGGNGGNIKLAYTANNFIPVFNHGVRKNGIDIFFQACKNGMNGNPGKGGLYAQDCKVTYDPVSESKHGNVTLVDASVNTDTE